MGRHESTNRGRRQKARSHGQLAKTAAGKMNSQRDLGAINSRPIGSPPGHPSWPTCDTLTFRQSSTLAVAYLPLEATTNNALLENLFNDAIA